MIPDSIANYGGILEGRGPDGALVPTTTGPEDQDAIMGFQLSVQFDKCVNNRRDDLILGAMGMRVREYISSARGGVHPGGKNAKGTGIATWLKTHAPKVSESILYRCIEIAEGVQDICKLGKKIDLEELLAGSVEDVPEKLRKKREEIEKLIEGKSQRQLLLSFGGASGKSRGGDTAGKEKTLTPEEEQAELEKSLREDATVPFTGLESMGDAWKLLTPAELETRVDIAQAWITKAQAWLRLPPSKRPVVDIVAAALRQKQQEAAVTHEPAEQAEPAEQGNVDDVLS